MKRYRLSFQYNVDDCDYIRDCWVVERNYPIIGWCVSNFFDKREEAIDYINGEGRNKPIEYEYFTRKE